MFTDQDETYRLPATPHKERRSGIPWRMIPAALIGLVGLLLATSIVPLIYLVFWNPLPDGEKTPAAYLSVLSTVGMIWLITAAAWWGRYWLLALGMTFAGYVVLAIYLPDR